jgi:signal transduction histidine kinase
MRRLPFTGLVLGWIAVFVAALGSIALPAHTHSVAPIWPANAIFLVLVLRLPSNLSQRLTCAALYGSALLAAELFGRNNWMLAVAFTFANCIEVGVATLALRRFYPNGPDLADIRQFATFLLVAAFVAPIAGAAAAGLGAGAVGLPACGNVCSAWFVADALGMAIIAPFLLAFRLDDWRALRSPSTRLDLFAVIAGLTGVAIATYFHRFALFLSVPIIMLAALRLGIAGAALAGLLTTLLGAALIFFESGNSLLVAVPIAQRLLAFQILMAANVLWALPVAAINVENKRLLAKISADRSRIEGESTEKSRLLDELQRTLVRAEERERLRLARELHDETGQAIAATMIEVNQLEPLVRPEKRAHIGRVRALLEEISRTLHHIAWQLRPTSINDCGLTQALHDCVAYWSDRTNIQIDLHLSPQDVDALDDDLRTAVYRIVQEALTNVAKHAGAGMASVVIKRIDGRLHIAAEDDGRGFDPAAAADAGGLGLLGMRERVKLLGGDFEIESATGAGTTVFARLPLDRETPR